jgi:hypothetical protein
MKLVKKTKLQEDMFHFGKWQQRATKKNYLSNRRRPFCTLKIGVRYIFFAQSEWFSLGTPVSANNKTDRYDITEIVLKVALNTITITTSGFGIFTSKRTILLASGIRPPSNFEDC